MGNKKLSSIEWMFDEMQRIEKDYKNEALDGQEYTTMKYYILEKAKELHKKEIMETYYDGTAQFASDARIDYPKTAEQYYQETFTQEEK